MRLKAASTMASGQKAVLGGYGQEQWKEGETKNTFTRFGVSHGKTNIT